MYLRKDWYLLNYKEYPKTYVLTQSIMHCFCLTGYTEGSLFLDNYDAEIRGTLPNVTVNGGVMFTFCCSDGQQYSNNSESHLYDSLPKMFPFVFLKVYVLLKDRHLNITKL